MTPTLAVYPWRTNAQRRGSTLFVFRSQAGATT